MPALNATVDAVTDRILDRSHSLRAAYLQRIDQMNGKWPLRRGLGCTNLAHGIAACSAAEKQSLLEDTVNLGIVSAYNDMLSAHQPFQHFPKLIHEAAQEVGAVAQFAGGVPAMCDGITQGEIGMEMSLFSRDVIAMATAVSLTHNMFDAALCLGICDKIVPGLLIGALSFPHLPVIFVPGGPMPSGISNSEKAKTRQLYAEGKIGDEGLLASEMGVYHAPGTCTFYGTANTNQMCMEVMGLHLPSAAFYHPYTPMRDALTKAAAVRATQITPSGNEYTPVGKVVDEKALVNAIVAVLATGGSTNHTIHLIAIARAAGLLVNWDDFNDLSSVVPMLARVYPNGSADVNGFHEAGGIAFVISQLLDAGLLHTDKLTVVGEGGLERWRDIPKLNGENKLEWVPAPRTSGDYTILRTVEKPFTADGGLKLMRGNLGRAVMKLSAVKPENRVVEAPALIFNSQEEVNAAFRNGELHCDFVAVVRFQGPKANGMPELHKLTPPLGVLQDKGYKIALVTDGRMSGASGKVPVALHVTPECAAGGALAKVRKGDVILVDGERGILEVRVDPAEWARREVETIDLAGNQVGMGRELFRGMRELAVGAEEGATTFQLL